MKLVMIAFVAACTQSPPAATPRNETPVADLRCKTAVERAAPIAELRPRDITMTIGECEQQEWSRPLRECVNVAKSEADLISCGTQYDRPKQGLFRGASGFAAAMKAMHHFKDEMCACSSTACAQQVSDEMTKWSQDEARDHHEPPKMSEDDVKQATALGEEMGKCMMKAMGTGTTP
jgi:hypothetical protein